MTLRLTIEIGGPPQGKGRGRAVSTAHGARVYTPTKTRTYESQLRYAAQQAMGDQPPTPHPVRVVVSARFPIAASWSKKKQAAARSGALWPATKPDCDNILKCIDAFNGIIWVDDRQVVVVTVRKIYSDRPRMTIEVDELAPIPSMAPPATPRGQREASDMFALGAST